MVLSGSAGLQEGRGGQGGCSQDVWTVGRPPLFRMHTHSAWLAMVVGHVPLDTRLVVAATVTSALQKDGGQRRGRGAAVQAWPVELGCRTNSAPEAPRGRTAAALDAAPPPRSHTHTQRRRHLRPGSQKSSGLHTDGKVLVRHDNALHSHTHTAACLLVMTALPLTRIARINKRVPVAVRSARVGAVDLGWSDLHHEIRPIADVRHGDTRAPFPAATEEEGGGRGGGCTGPVSERVRSPVRSPHPAALHPPKAVRAWAWAWKPRTHLHASIATSTNTGPASPQKSPLYSLMDSPAGHLQGIERGHNKVSGQRIQHHTNRVSVWGVRMGSCRAARVKH